MEDLDLDFVAQMARDQERGVRTPGAPACRYCPEQVHVFGDGLVSMLCAFHVDWECACNLSEDEFNGYTFGWYVRDKMREWGWSDQEIEKRLAKETV